MYSGISGILFKGGTGCLFQATPTCYILCTNSTVILLARNRRPNSLVARAILILVVMVGRLLLLLGGLGKHAPPEIELQPILD